MQDIFRENLQNRRALHTGNASIRNRDAEPSPAIPPGLGEQLHSARDRSTPYRRHPPQSPLRAERYGPEQHSIPRRYCSPVRKAQWKNMAFDAGTQKARRCRIRAFQTSGNPSAVQRFSHTAASPACCAGNAESEAFSPPAFQSNPLNGSPAYIPRRPRLFDTPEFSHKSLLPAPALRQNPKNRLQNHSGNPPRSKACSSAVSFLSSHGMSGKRKAGVFDCPHCTAKRPLMQAENKKLLRAAAGRLPEP